MATEHGFESTGSLLDETRLRDFERQWIARERPAIDEFLPPPDESSYLPTLVELVQIELEFAWKHFQAGSTDKVGETSGGVKPDAVERYVERYPHLADVEILVDLARHEFSLRHRYADRPAIDEYRDRFPEAVTQETDWSLLADEAARKRASAASPTDDLKQLGDYEVYEQIGRGGMGVVFRARQRSVDRVVALKVIRTDAFGDWSTATRADKLARFRNEAQAACRLSHSGIVTVYEVGVEDDRHYISMQYVDGSSLRELVENGPLETRRAATILRLTARAVHDAHQHGILHRDLKPHNILIETATDRPLVADFGLAKLAEGGEEVTRTGDVFGTPQYMSPEQARESAGATVASDVYSLGATLYHLITGRAPFDAQSTAGILRQVEETLPPFPRGVNERVDSDLETICLKCLDKEPAGRYVSASDLADDLDRYLNGEPIEARPVTRLQRTYKWARRKPLLAVLIASVLLLFGFLGGIGWQLAVSIFHRNEAIDARDLAAKAEKRARDAEREKQALLARSYADAGLLATSRGEVRKAVDFFERAIAEGHADPVGMRLRQVQAWVSFGAVPKAVAAIQELSKQRNLGSHEGQVLLWQAELAVGTKPATGDPASLYRKALSKGLPPADEAYVRGMLSKTSPECMSQFRRALEIEPYHQGASVGIMLMQFSLGRLDDLLVHVSAAQRLFPDIPAYHAMEAMVHALRDDQAAAAATLRDAGSLFSENDKQRLLRFLEFLRTAPQAFAIYESQPGAEQRLLTKIIAMITTNRILEIPLFRPGTQPHPSGKLPSLATRLRFPPIIGSRLAAAYIRVLAARLFGRHTAAADELLPVLAVNPEGTLFLLRGNYLSFDEKWKEAAAAYEKALATPAVLSHVKRQARIGLLLASGMRFFTVELRRKTPDRKPLDRALDMARELTADPPRRGAILELGAILALYDKKYALARRWLDAWDALAALDGAAAEPKPRRFQRLRRRMYLENETDHEAAAIRAARLLLQMNPDNQDAQNMLNDLLRRVRLLLENSRRPAKARRPRSARGE